MTAFVPPDLDGYFKPIATHLEHFALSNGLRFERYYHDAPVLSLCFGHPKGGQAKVEVAAQSTADVVVSGVWWLDDYRTFTRSLIWGAKSTTSLNSNTLLQQVQSCFREVLGWELGNWTQVVDGYEPYWSNIGEKHFPEFSNPWPLPSPEGVA